MNNFSHWNYFPSVRGKMVVRLQLSCGGSWLQPSPRKEEEWRGKVDGKDSGAHSTSWVESGRAGSGGHSPPASSAAVWALGSGPPALWTPAPPEPCAFSSPGWPWAPELCFLVKRTFKSVTNGKRIAQVAAPSVTWVQLSRSRWTPKGPERAHTWHHEAVLEFG